MMKRRISTFVVAIAAALPACGGRQALPVDDVTLTAGRFDTLPDLRGTWARLEVTSTVAQVPLLGEIRTLHQAVGLVEVSGEPDALTTTSTLCAIDIDSDSGSVETTVPEAYARSVVESASATRAALVDQQVALEPFTVVMAAGYDVDDFDATVPADASDPRVFDADSDGEPGVTFHVAGMVDGDVRIATRRARVFTPTHVTADTIDGELSWSAERTTFSATSSRLERQREQAPDPDGPSYFLTTRVAPGTTCDDILARRDELFAREANAEAPDASAPAP